MKNYRNLLPLAIAFLAGSVVSLTTTLVLAHDGDTNLIHGCVKNSNGSIRIVGENDTCSGSETALDWNSQGLPGTGGFITNLQGANLNSADLRYRSFKDANLSNASFEQAQFASTDLSNANLSNAVLRRSSFADNNLTTTNLSNANLTLVIMNNVNLTNKNLTNVEFAEPSDNVGFTITNSNLSGSNLSNIDINSPDAANLSGSNLTGANLTSFNADKGIGHGEGALFINTTITQTNFTNASIKEADFSNAIGSQTNFTNTNLEGATGLDTASLSGTIWSNTTCPDGTNSNSNGGTCNGHLTP